MKSTATATRPSLLVMAAGFCLAWAACAWLPLLYHAESYQIFRRQLLPTYALFDPARSAQPKNVFVGASYIINPWVTNDLDLPDWPSIEDPGSTYSSTATLVARRELDVKGQGFYELGRLGTSFLDHVWYLNQALDAPNLKTIVYATGHTGMYHFSDKRIVHEAERASLEALYVLDGWTRRFPRSAPAIEAYMALIQASPAYARALTRFGQDWRSRIDPKDGVIYDKPGWAIRDKLPGGSHDPLGTGLRGNPEFAVNKPAELRDALLLRYSLLTGQSGEAGQRRTLRLLDLAARFYGDSRLDIPIRISPPENPFAGPEAGAHLAWTRMVAEVLREAGVRLVWFFPPEVSIPPAIYEAYYKPGVVDVVRGLIEPLGHMVSDHVIRHGLNQRDFMIQEESDKQFGLGYRLTSIGKLKSTRLLLADMAGRDLLDAAPGVHPSPWPSCWPGEARLPHVAMCVRPYSELGPQDCLPWPREPR